MPLLGDRWLHLCLQLLAQVECHKDNLQPIYVAYLLASSQRVEFSMWAVGGPAEQQKFQGTIKDQRKLINSPMQQHELKSSPHSHRHPPLAPLHLPLPRVCLKMVVPIGAKYPSQIVPPQKPRLQFSYTTIANAGMICVVWNLIRGHHLFRELMKAH